LVFILTEQTENQENLRNREIRSFVVRPGRFTPGQKQAYERDWDSLGFEISDGRFDPQEAFGRDNPRTLEIGFGMGKSLVEMAKADPERDFIGIEVHMPGVGAALKEAHEQGVTNVRFFKEDAVEVLRQCIDDNSLDRVQLFFPDPWHKKRHHKRRIVRPDFVQLVRQKLKVGGWFHMATDWEPYTEHMMEIMEPAEGYENMAGAGQFTPRPDFRPLTKFEARGERLGHGVWDLIYVRKD